MRSEQAPVAVGPLAYSAWRATPLGARTERLEHELILRFAGDLAGARVLDAGCGDGVLSLALAMRGAHVTGVDSDARMLAAGAARARAAGAAVRFIRGTIERLPFADASFDTIAAVTVLCFIAKPARVLAEFRRVLVPGGTLVIGELNRWSFWALGRGIRARLGAPLWRRAHFTDVRVLRRLLTATGFTADAFQGCVFYPPSAPLARLMAPVETPLGRLTTFGAAFVAARATANTAAEPRSAVFKKRA